MDRVETLIAEVREGIKDGIPWHDPHGCDEMGCTDDHDNKDALAALDTISDTLRRYEEEREQPAPEDVREVYEAIDDHPSPSKVATARAAMGRILDLAERAPRSEADTLREQLSRVSALADELEEEAAEPTVSFSDEVEQAYLDAKSDIASRIRNALQTVETGGTSTCICGHGPETHHYEEGVPISRRGECHARLADAVTECDCTRFHRQLQALQTVETKEEEEMNRTKEVLDVIEAARQFKRGFVAKKAKEIGIHDPELPDVDVSLDELRRGRLGLFDALAELDGPEPHEQVVREVVEQETGIS